MLNRISTFLAGFFVYVADLLCFVQVPPEMSKPALVAGFAAIATACALAALALRRFTEWKRTLASILIGGSLMSAVAVATITALRTYTPVKQTFGAEQLDGFREYRTGGTVTLIVLAAGTALALLRRRKSNS